MKTPFLGIKPPSYRVRMNTQKVSNFLKQFAVFSQLFCPCLKKSPCGIIKLSTIIFFHALNIAYAKSINYI